jgi:osomolarity two-component system response regulator SKN7
MLDDQSIANVVSWGPAGDCFVVKDMNEFTKSILPRMFKHSNFASFVRQLNKYDFHKVRFVNTKSPI